MASKAPDRAPLTGAARRRSPDALSIGSGMVGLVYLIPLGFLIWGIGHHGGSPAGLLTEPSNLVPLGNSMLLATATAVACGVVGTFVAWMATRTDLAGRAIWRLLIPLPLVIPSFVAATALLAAFGPGGLIPFVPRLRGFWGALIVLTALSYPYVSMPVAARLRTMAPNLEEVAAGLDPSAWRRFRTIVLPQIHQTVAGGMLLVFLYALSDFGAVALLRFDTITRVIYATRLSDRAVSLTFGLVLAVAALAVAAFAHRTGTTEPSEPTDGVTPIAYPLGRWKAPATGAVACVVGVGFFAPVVVFLLWMLRGQTTVGVGYSGLGDDLGFLVSPIVNSTVAALAAAAAAVVVVLPVAYAVARRADPLARAASATVASVFALPGIVVALALVVWAVQAPGPLAGLYQTFPLLVLAYVLHFGAQSMTATKAAIDEVPDRYAEAAHTLGASRLRRVLTIDLPLITPGVVAGAGLVMLSTLKELPATLLLAPTGFSTLATKIWGAAEDGFFAEAGVASLTLILLSGILTWLLIVRPDA